jgi:non-ribosomal peptide synthase protein (TIGR01720 family)
VVFNYLGQVDNIISESKWFSGVSESVGANRSEENILSEKLAVNGLIQGGELAFSWTYSTKHYEEATINRLAEAFITNLEKLIDHCVEHKKGGTQVGYTPSDFGLGSDVSYDELDRFMEEEDNIDNILSF